MPFVSRVSTDQGVFEVGGDRVRVRATYGVTPDELRRRLAVGLEPAAGH
jgi:acyl CoA:acetate/3-ketoacid CoA transferase beta subunit